MTGWKVCGPWYVRWYPHGKDQERLQKYALERRTENVMREWLNETFSSIVVLTNSVVLIVVHHDGCCRLRRRVRTGCCCIRTLCYWRDRWNCWIEMVDECFPDADKGTSWQWRSVSSWECRGRFFSLGLVGTPFLWINQAVEAGEFCKLPRIDCLKFVKAVASVLHDLMKRWSLGTKRRGLTVADCAEGREGVAFHRGEHVRFLCRSVQARKQRFVEVLALELCDVFLK